VPRYEGRLELTWTNKHERLLAHDDGSYEWVSHPPKRASLTRRLRDQPALAATPEPLKYECALET
jgi:adenine-specific DNA-methyltransferase